jgi:hypothetical protein
MPAPRIHASKVQPTHTNRFPKVLYDIQEAYSSRWLRFEVTFNGSVAKESHRSRDKKKYKAA